jgi:hypothetical protein
LTSPPGPLSKRRGGERENGDLEIRNNIGKEKLRRSLTFIALRRKFAKALSRRDKM